LAVRRENHCRRPLLSGRPRSANAADDGRKHSEANHPQSVCRFILSDFERV